MTAPIRLSDLEKMLDAGAAMAQALQDIITEQERSGSGTPADLAEAVADWESVYKPLMEGVNELSTLDKVVASARGCCA